MLSRYQRHDLKELVRRMSETDRDKANVLMQVNKCSWQEAVLELMTSRSETASSPWRVAFRSSFSQRKSA